MALFWRCRKRVDPLSSIWLDPNAPRTNFLLGAWRFAGNVRGTGEEHPGFFASAEDMIAANKKNKKGHSAVWWQGKDLS